MIHCFFVWIVAFTCYTMVTKEIEFEFEMLERNAFNHVDDNVLDFIAKFEYTLDIAAFSCLGLHYQSQPSLRPRFSRVSLHWEAIGR